VTVVGYAFEEAWASLRRSGRSALVSIGTIAIAFITLGGFLLLSVNVQGVLERWLEAAEMSIYLHDTASDADRTALEEFLRVQPAVAAVEYVPRERALERFRADFPELRDVADGVGENPFPAVLEVRLRSDLAGDTAAESLSRDVEGRPGVGDVRYDRRWLSRLVGIVNAARLAGGLAAAILMLGAAFTVAAVVRLSLYARRDEAFYSEGSAPEWRSWPSPSRIPCCPSGSEAISPGSPVWSNCSSWAPSRSRSCSSGESASARQPGPWRRVPFVEFDRTFNRLACPPKRLCAKVD
jgi:cell division transport system permease protein